MWSPMTSAPTTGIIVLAVVSAAGERKSFVAEASYNSAKQGRLEWMITTGWGGWTWLHSSWTPVAWTDVPKKED